MDKEEETNKIKQSSLILDLKKTILKLSGGKKDGNE